MNPKIIALVAAVGLMSPPVRAEEPPSGGSSSSSSSSGGSSSSSTSGGSHSGDEHTNEAPNLILINLGDLLNGVVSLEYERALNSFVGIEVGMSVMSFRGVFDPPVKANVIAIAPEVGIRFHFIQDAPGGLWIGPSLTAAYIAPNAGGTAPRAYGYGFGAAIGYNFILGRHFVFQLGFGGAVNDYGEGLAWSPHVRLGVGATF